jgi:hypothetical protein
MFFWRMTVWHPHWENTPALKIFKAPPLKKVTRVGRTKFVEVDEIFDVELFKNKESMKILFYKHLMMLKQRVFFLHAVH